MPAKEYYLTFKTPDVLDQLEFQCDSEEELEEAREVCGKFLEFSEYIHITIQKDGNKLVAFATLQEG